MNPRHRLVMALNLAWFTSSCAALHSVMLSDVEPRRKGADVIDIKVSENTVNFEELARVGKQLGKLDKFKEAGELGDLIALYTTLFQWGPKTGTPVFNPYYAQVVPELVQAKCPGGRVTDIISIREGREYPVVKGEIIRIRALCHSGKGKS